MRSKRSSQPSITDVAKLAGVSTATVSRYFNNRSVVRPKTAEKIEAVVSRLGYQPNPLARAFVTGTTDTILVFTWNLPLFGPSSVINGIIEEGRGSGNLISIFSVDPSSYASVNTAIDHVREERPKGLIFTDFESYGRKTLDAMPFTIPAVSIVGDLTDGDYNQVSVCDEAGGERVTSYLLSLGHRTVHYVAGTLTGISGERPVSGRELGWRHTLLKAGITPPLPVSGADTPRQAYEIGRRLAHDEDVTAVFAGNDVIAMSVIGGIVAEGKRVPDDISVVGFDDTPIAEVYTPALTTYAVPFDRVGRALYSMLIDVADGVGDDGNGAADAIAGRHTREFTGELKIRQSAAPPRA
ncbi:LacI family DNA-binding transcriptional regulator [Bifidobacterium sp. 82T24]|uniref:LacI family DNA-binding transcriptional regulator n=1 Tax=Bifidobacterium pluvialisilvae TaxID=2834436 RepID=UPI001C57FAB0|nr:LacI family DNA-binding transcriptional regulator [Bifidobacterium pluvialisilvae]MBW3087517.1 LacI family DNA-binding transcriptional regulator [Bifidobacterium pluvialisilvae]